MSIYPNKQALVMNLGTMLLFWICRGIRINVCTLNDGIWGQGVDMVVVLGWHIGKLNLTT